jgi:hypothetical protein
VNYVPVSGKVLLKRLRPLHNKSVADREMELMHTLAKRPARPPDDGVELFS